MKRVAVCMVAVLLLTAVAPAYATVAERKALTNEEQSTLSAQQAQDAPAVAEVAAGDEGTTVLAAVGVVLLLLIIIGAAASSGG